ncbi:hypothetical protein U4I37_16035 [Stenotrophomonas maltophilia]|uniref:hypothetical protein n=1 Tax=Stenotrophomonas maltophilia TaxID=40324 RepID=UPI002ACD1BDF|nr:hypothetical protein [Stenotrophomonas maltophilia]MDZ5787752.1 hypothetical protein [Stenotrophomonas maltophilia]
MSAYEIKVSITPLCPSCGKESHSGGFVAESRAPQGVFDRDSPTERKDQRVFITPCNDCFVHRAAVAELIEASDYALQATPGAHQLNANTRLMAALARVKGGAR